MPASVQGILWDLQHVNPNEQQAMHVALSKPIYL